MNQQSTLYTYFRSSASYRVRIALNLKDISVDSQFVDLRQGAQSDPCYVALNPQGIVPFYKDESISLSQSMTILEYLEVHYPMPPLLPPSHHPLHWKARSLSQYIACEMHPLNNLRVLRYLTNVCNLSDDQKNAWYHHWMHQGFKVLEQELSCFDTPYALWDSPTWVDLCLVPHMYNARRFLVDVSSYPRLQSIESHCLGHDAFVKASPEEQKDCDL